MALPLNHLGSCYRWGLIAVKAWSEPASAPPGGNIGAPINTSGIGQIKSGALQVNGFRNLGATILDGNVGIGVIAPGAKLDVAGTIQTTGLKLTAGAGAGKVLTSDASGAASWGNLPAAGGSVDYSDCYEVAAFSSPSPDHVTISRIQCNNNYIMIGLGTYHYPYNYADMANIKCCKLH